MGQLNFAINNFIPPNQNISVNNGSLTFCPFNITDNISWNTINIPYNLGGLGGGTKSISFSIGLYSLNGSTLSLANSAFNSEAVTLTGAKGKYIVITSISSAQNITPGTWWIAYLMSTSATAANITASLYGQSSGLSAANAFPGSFIGGAMTVSTNALPTAYSISDLDITGQDAFPQPVIILTS